ncbi:ATP-binding protein [Sphingomonas sp. CJ99]
MASHLLPWPIRAVIPFGHALRLIALVLPAMLVAVPASAAQPVAAMVELARTQMATDPERADATAAAAVAKARAAGADDALAAAIGLQAEAALRMRQADRALPLIEQALSISKGGRVSDRTRGQLLLTRGGVRAAGTDVAASLSDYQAAYRHFLNAKDRRSQAVALVAIGSLYREGADYESALKYYRQALTAYDDDVQLTVFILNNRGNVLVEMDRYQEAVQEFEAALQRVRVLGSSKVEATIHRNLARAYRPLGQLDRADQSINAGLALLQGPGTESARAQLLGVASRVALDRKNVGRAISLARQSLDGVDPDNSSLAYRDTHLSAYLAFEAAGDQREALVHLKALERLDEQATKLAISTKTALMAARFDFQNQELQIARLKAEELRRNVEFERARQRFQLTLFIGIAVAVSVLVALLGFGVITLRRSRNQVRAANVELGRTNTALEKALAAKTEFLATTSHEIRTPLNGILGMTQVMLADPRLEAATRDRITVVHGAGVTMRALVDDILDVAKMETGNLTIEQVPMDLPATLTDVSRLWQDQARAKGLSFDLSIDPALGWMEGDPARLRQIAFNLLSNALKFTVEGRVALAARAAGDRLLLEISDSGIGIPPEKREEIFESFKQADSGTTRQFGGTGLGLAICRNLARAMGGDIAVDSTVGVGSTFTVDLPLIRADAPAAMTGAVPAADDTGILVIERNPIARAMLKTLLAPRFPAVALVGSVDEALEHPPCRAILADEATLSTGGDAAAVIARLVALGEDGPIPLLMLAQPMADADRQALLAAGASQILQKPVAGDVVVTSLQQFAGYTMERGLVPQAA